MSSTERDHTAAAGGLTRVEKALDRWAWIVAGGITAGFAALGLLSEPAAIARGNPPAQVALLAGYLLFVLVAPLAALAGMVAPLWCVVKRGERLAPRVVRIVVSMMAAALWYWCISSRYVELP